MDLAYINNKPAGHRPKTLVCYICGREFGTRSLEIHLKSCEKKFENEQNQLPKNKRKPVPQPPKGFKNMIRMAQGKKPLPNEEMPDDMMDGGNDDIYGQFKQNGGGGVMQKDPFKAIQMYNQNAFKNWDQNILEQCPNCQRTFRPEAMVHHKRACTAEKPLKPLRKTENGETILQKSKSPNLGLAARQVAAIKQGKFADEEYGVDRDRDRSQHRTTQSKQFQTRVAQPIDSRSRQNLESQNQHSKRTASIDLQARNRNIQSHRTTASESQNMDDINQSKVGNQMAMPAKKKRLVSPRDESNSSTNNNGADEKMPKWKQEREQFIKAVRLGKQINMLEKNPNLNSDPELQDQIRVLASKMPSNQQEMVECPHCKRKFNKKAAERHIEKCATIQNRPKPPPTKEQVEKKRNFRMKQYGSPRRDPRPKYDREKQLRNSTIHEAMAPNSYQQQTDLDHYSEKVKDGQVERQLSSHDFQDIKNNFGKNNQMVQQKYHQKTNSYMMSQLDESQLTDRSLLKSPGAPSLQNEPTPIKGNKTEKHESEKIIYIKLGSKQQEQRRYTDKSRSPVHVSARSNQEQYQQQYCPSPENKKFPSVAERTALYSNVECPTCFKKFSKKVALRHIPNCQEKTNSVRLATPTLSKHASNMQQYSARSRQSRESMAGNSTNTTQIKSPRVVGCQKMTSQKSDRERPTPVKHAISRLQQQGRPAPIQRPMQQYASDMHIQTSNIDQQAANVKSPRPPTGKIKRGVSPVKGYLSKGSISGRKLNLRQDGLTSQKNTLKRR